MSQHVRARLFLYSFVALLILVACLTSGCGFSSAADGKSRWTVGFVHEKDRKENANFGIGKGAWNQSVAESHNPWVDCSGGSAAIRR